MARLVSSIASDFEYGPKNTSEVPILATTYDGRADYLVSGDEDLLNMEKFRGIRIVKVAEMLKMFK